jgi:hypothetical protein
MFISSWLEIQIHSPAKCVVFQVAGQNLICRMTHGTHHFMRTPTHCMAYQDTQTAVEQALVLFITCMAVKKHSEILQHSSAVQGLIQLRRKRLVSFKSVGTVTF